MQIVRKTKYAVLLVGIQERKVFLIPFFTADKLVVIWLSTAGFVT